MEKLNILVIENKNLIALKLVNTIKNFGYHQISYATNTKIAKEILSKSTINLILMDINLNESIDGITFYQKLKKKIPIIYLTAYKDEQTISRAVTTDPLGYLIKPINKDELKVFLKLALYKTEVKVNQSNKILLGEGYSFNTIEDKLFLNNSFVNLGTKELQLLKMLIVAKGNFISYLSIENEIWKGEYISSSAIRTLIYRLRKKLKHQFIENEMGYGIRFRYC